MRVTIKKDVMAAFDHVHTRLYQAGEEHEIGSVLMPQELADKLAKEHIPAAPAFGHPGGHCAVIDDKPVSEEWHRKHDEILNELLGNDKQLHSVNYPGHW